MKSPKQPKKEAMSKAQPIITDNNGRDDKGRFAPGNTGRPTGSQNRSTSEYQSKRKKSSTIMSPT